IITEQGYHERIDSFLDQGHGELFLADPRIANLVQSALKHFDGKRYDLHGWVIMPNHVHVLFTQRAGHRLSDILHSWKSFTAKEANKILGRKGAFWQDDYFDRFIRDDEHFCNTQEYMAFDPVKAGLCPRPEDWLFSSFTGNEHLARL